MTTEELARAIAEFFDESPEAAAADGEQPLEMINPVAALDDGDAEAGDDDGECDTEEADLAPPIEILPEDLPLPITLSFTEQMDGFCAALTEEMSMQNAELVRMSPERWVWTACYDRAGDDRYTGQLGINPVTGKEEVFVSAIDGRTTILP